MYLHQPSLAGGEIAPSLHARVDLAKYHIALALCKNYIIHPHGGASKRHGTIFIGEVNNSATAVRLIPFQFNTEQAYILEFGHQYMRVVMNGGHVLEAAQNITGVTQANPAVVTIAGHGYATGDEVYITGVVGMTEVNGKRFKITVIDPDTFSLNGVDSTGYGAYSSGGTAARVYTLVTPYAAADLFLIKFRQSADVMTLYHPSYQTRELSRTGHAAWSIATQTIGPDITAPTGVNAVATVGSGSINYKYVVTAYVDETGDESVASASANCNNNLTTTGNYNTVSWNAVAGASRYFVYRERGGMYGFVGAATGLTFKDDNILPDLTSTPPLSTRDPFSGVDNYPACGTYFQQRSVQGGSNNSPQTLEMSQIGNYDNHNTSYPLADSDAISAMLNALQVNAIRHMVPMRDLVVFTSGGEWVAASSSGGISPTSLEVKQHGYSGCSHLRPLVVGNSILFVQEKDSIVRDLRYDMMSDGYSGDDRSVMAYHLLDTYSVVDWAFAQVPDSIIWAARNDGKLVALTYMREHEVFAWHQHELAGGQVESICSIPEGQHDSVYMVVRRTINGSVKRYIEKLDDEDFTDAEDGFYVDCGLTYYNPVAVTGITSANPPVVTAAAHGMNNGDIVDFRDIADADGADYDEVNGVQFRVANAAANTFELTDKDTGVNINGTAWPTFGSGGTCAEAVTTLSGLEHLEGETLVALANGGVETGLIVSGGAITLASPASKVHVGIRITSDLKTLRISEGMRDASAGYKKVVSRVLIQVDRSRGLKVGPNENKLQEVRSISEHVVGTIELFTGDVDVQIYPDWNQYGQLFIRHDEPLPSNILSIVPEVTYGG